MVLVTSFTWTLIPQVVLATNAQSDHVQLVDNPLTKSAESNNPRWEFFLPIHMVNLQIPQYGIKADVIDMAKSATGYASYEPPIRFKEITRHLGC